MNEDGKREKLEGEGEIDQKIGREEMGREEERREENRREEGGR